MSELTPEEIEAYRALVMEYDHAAMDAAQAALDAPLMPTVAIIQSDAYADLLAAVVAASAALPNEQENIGAALRACRMSLENLRNAIRVQAPRLLS